MNTIEGFRLAALHAALLIACSAAQAASGYSFTALDTFGGSTGSGNAVNVSGTVAGEATLPPDDQDPPSEPPRSALWKGTQPVELAVLQQGPYARAYGINDAGLVVGVSFLPNSSGVHATLWDNGVPVDLGTLGGSSDAYAINKAGVIVGSSSLPDGAGSKALVWKNGRMKILKGLGGPYSQATSISSNGLIAGASTKTNGAGYAVIWRDGAVTPLGPGRANGVNRAGVAVGEAMSETGYVHAAMWNGSSAADLGTLGGDQSQAYGINDAGDVVGASSVAGCCDYRATLWRKGKMIDLNSLVSASVRDAGWVLVQARAIDRAGHITGVASNKNQPGSRAFLLTPQQ